MCILSCTKKNDDMFIFFHTCSLFFSLECISSPPRPFLIIKGCWKSSVGNVVKGFSSNVVSRKQKELLNKTCFKIHIFSHLTVVAM